MVIFIEECQHVDRRIRQINPGDLQVTTAASAEGGSRLGFICFPAHWGIC